MNISSCIVIKTMIRLALGNLLVMVVLIGVMGLFIIYLEAFYLDFASGSRGRWNSMTALIFLAYTATPSVCIYKSNYN